MREALTKNWGFKVLALGFSFLLWLAVVNVQDPVMTKTFTGVPVTVVHPEIITNRGNTYQVVEGTETVSVVVKAKRSDMEKLRADSIVATADMKNLDTKSGTLIPIDVTITASVRNSYEAYATPGNIQIQIEANKTKSFPITVNTSGNLKDGYVLGEAKANPEKIEISGPESVVTSIDKVVASVQLNGESEDTELEARLEIYDANGKSIAMTTLEDNLNGETVKVSITVQQKKNVAVYFDTSGIQVADGYVLEDVSAEPETIEVVGEADELDKIDSIKVPAEALQETNLAETVERTVDVANYIPRGLRVLDETKGAPVVVKITVAKAGTKRFEFPVGSISVLNLPNGYKVSYDTTGNIEIAVIGTKEELDYMSELEQGSVYINLIDMKSEGSYTVPLEIVLPNGVQLDHEVTIGVTLEKE